LFLFLQSNKQEELLMAQLQSLRDQYDHKKNTVNDHVSQVELLRDEVCAQELLP
jgi:hypothetical protein